MIQNIKEHYSQITRTCENGDRTQKRIRNKREKNFHKCQLNWEQINTTNNTLINIKDKKV